MYTNITPTQGKRGILDHITSYLTAAYLYQIPTLMTVVYEQLQSELDIDLVMPLIATVDTLHPNLINASSSDEQLENNCLDIIRNVHRSCMSLLEKVEMDIFIDLMQQKIYIAQWNTQTLVTLLQNRSTTPLLLAVRCQLPRVVEALIEQGVSVDDRGPLTI